MGSLTDVYDMSWAEFVIRSSAFRRKENREWQRVRKIAYSALIGPHQDPKKLPKKESIFMKLDGDKKEGSGVSQAQKDAFMEAFKEYKKKVDGRT